MIKSPILGKCERVSMLLGLVHLDVCGPMNINTQEGYSYFISFTNNYSSYGYMYLMNWSINMNLLKNSKKLIRYLNTFRSNRSGEYYNQEF